MLVTFGATSLRLAPPGRGRLETAPTFDVTVTGAESNAAVAAARLGAEATWLSKLPDSPLGRRVAGTLRDHGVRTDVTWTDGRQGVRYVERGATPRAGASVDDGASAAVSRISVEELSPRLDEARLLYVTGATMALSTDLVRTVAGLLKEASDAGVRTAFGVRYRDQWSVEEARDTLTGLFPAVDVLVGSERDLRTVFERGEDTPREIAHSLGATYDFAQVAIHRDRGGILWEDATVHEHRAPETRTVDPHGAEDAFAGAYLAGLLDGSAPEDVLGDAVATAALARTVEGDLATVTPAEVAAVRERMAAEE
jgi:2-dehydro-3-deoxygluconokinase